MNSLSRIRSLASTGTMLLLWINVALFVAMDSVIAPSFSIFGTLASVILAGGVSLWWLRDCSSATYRTINSMALAVQVALLVYAASGSSLQIDMHMYFFATLAITAAWVDWRAIVGYAAMVAVHHIVFYFALPAAVFPGQSDFTRVLVHAVILIVQSGVMIMLVSEITKAFLSAEASSADADAARIEALANSDLVRRADEQANAERQQREMEKAKESEDLLASIGIITHAMSELSNGNLSYRIRQNLSGSIDGLRETFNSSLENLEQAMGEVGHTADIVRGDTQKIRVSNDDLAKRSEQQAVSVEETAASLSEVTMTVRDTAKRAEDVNRLVETTKTNAEQSANVVTNAVAAMGKIEESSNQISQIIGVIDEIAFQTNLLALNAGVEAARAGDAGKGFAVVAQEVRELAQRSANAAKEIKALINTSGDQVKQGVQLVAATGTALSAIAVEVKDIAANVQAIVVGAREQAIGLETINSAINAIDQNTQRNTAVVQASTVAAQSLSQEVDTMDQLLKRFTVSAKAGQYRQAA